MRTLLLCIVLVITGDLLFYGIPENVPIGLSMGVFFALCFIALIVHKPLQAKKYKESTFLALLFILPLFEDLNILSVIFALCGMALFTLSMKFGKAQNFQNTAKRLLLFTFAIPIRFFHDLRIFKKIICFWSGIFSPKSLLSWLLPIGITSIFLFLFIIANPVLGNWLSALQTWLTATGTNVAFLSLQRVALWLVLVIAIWPFLRPAIFVFSCQQHLSNAKNSASSKELSANPIFSETVILRSLVLCNLLFAIQSSLDITYLWGGVSLPESMTYAEYAQKGVFPLILAALLAAGFILLSTECLQNEKMRVKVKALMLLWIGQMILLTISCILRMYLYISAYSMTHARLIGLIVIGLITLGLLWIIIRLLFEKQTLWLVKVNALTLIVVLYIFCFIDTNYMIAQFNVRHAKEVGGLGVNLDIWYINKLGPSALPALKWYFENMRSEYKKPERPGLYVSSLEARHKENIEDFKARLSNWREYTFRNYRLIYFHHVLEIQIQTQIGLHDPYKRYNQWQNPTQ